MRQFLVIIFLINMGVIVWAFGPLGLLFALGVFAISYFILGQKFELKKRLPEKIAIGIVFALGIAGVQAALGNPFFTLIVGVMEVMFFFMSTSTFFH